MNVAPIAVARVTNQLRDSKLLSTVQGSLVDLLKVQQQISTGQKLNLASDDPAAASSIEQFKRELDDNAQTTNNLNFAQSYLKTADNALGSLSSLITQAQTVASSTVSSTVSSDERSAQASVIDSLLQQASSLGNTRYLNQSVFGGANGISDAFASVSGGYKFQGSTNQQNISTGTGQTLQYTVNGNAIFGGQSAQVVGYRQLNPAPGGNTPLSSLNGSLNNGISLGPISVSDGTTSTVVDLTGAVTFGDVISRFNTATAAAGISATLSSNNDHYVVNNTGASSLTVADPTGQSVAADLGIASTTAASSITNGPSVNARVTDTTPLTALNAASGIGTAGFVITNGALHATIATPTTATVGDLVSAINNSGTQVHAEINSAGTGINIFNSLSGSDLHIGENGGTAADDLGIRSFTGATQLSSLNFGQGVTPISSSVSGPSGNIVVTRTNGASFNVNVTGIKNSSDLIAAINSAAGNTTVTAALNTTGNGITLTDTTGGPGNISVAASPTYVSNGSNLGILSTGTGGTLTGGNVQLSTDDALVTRRDGSTFTVNLSGLTDIQSVLNAINTAPGNTNPATHVNAALNTNGNGISLTDPTTGSTVFSVAALNASSAPSQLGIAQTATGGSGQIAGTDVNGLQPTGLFSSLTLLRNSLIANDTAGITRAAALLGLDSQRVIQAHGAVGAREADISSRLDQASSEKISLTQSLSLVNDVDPAEAITRFTSLQTTYQASLEVAAKANNLSLLDFLK